MIVTESMGGGDRPNLKVLLRCKEKVEKSGKNREARS